MKNTNKVNQIIAILELLSEAIYSEHCWKYNKKQGRRTEIGQGGSIVLDCARESRAKIPTPPVSDFPPPWAWFLPPSGHILPIFSLLYR